MSYPWIGAVVDRYRRHWVATGQSDDDDPAELVIVEQFLQWLEEEAHLANFPSGLTEQDVTDYLAWEARLPEGRRWFSRLRPWRRDTLVAFVAWATRREAGKAA